MTKQKENSTSSTAISSNGMLPEVKLGGLFKTQKEIEASGIDRCEFDDECDFCDTPEGGSYARISNSECGQEAHWYICAKCATEVINRAESFYDIFPK